MLEGFERKDPPSQPRLAIPLLVIKHLQLQAKASTSQKTKSFADLCAIAFYYLLRVGEYTYKSPSRKSRTIAFRVSDVCFWENDRILPLSLSKKQLLKRATSCTLTIDNQKNGGRAASITQDRIPNDPTCPVVATINCVKHTLDHLPANSQWSANLPLGMYFKHPGSKGLQPMASAINTAIKQAVVDLGLDKKGLTPDLVSSHSLRAGGAMAMHLNGVSPITIQKMGRWSSTTWLDYIHVQLSCFGKGVSKKMSNAHTFRNVVYRPAGNVRFSAGAA